MRHLQDEVRITFTRYALVPVFIITLACVAFALYNWNTSVLQRNHDGREMVADVIEGIVTDYEERTALVAVMGYDMEALRSDRRAQMDFYTAMYREVNITHDNTAFYLLDMQHSIVLSNRAELPQQLQTELGSWGILQRLDRFPGEAHFEFAASEQPYARDLLVGRAILRDGRIEGYILFVVPGAYLQQAITSPYVFFALTDSYDYTPIATADVFSDTQFQKLWPELRETEGLVALKKQHFYSSWQSILDGRLRVYAFSPVGNMLMQYIVGAGILLAMLLIMIPIIIFSVRRETQRKMEAIDELVAAITAVRKGNLERAVEIHTGNEFEIIGDAYNRMVKSLRELMELNEQKARAAVVSEMRQLESQFNPHFLFNTLENIKFMIKLDPNAAVRMVMDLSALLRYSINNEKQRVLLREDLQYLRHYIEIQQYRFGKRLVYEEEIEASALDCLVPKLLLQPIIENAMKYGADSGGEIHIRTEIRRSDTELYGSISDHGPGIEPAALQRLRSLMAQGENSSVHTGVYNIHRRIQLLYGGAYGLQIERLAAGGTKVSFQLPAIPEEEKE